MSERKYDGQIGRQCFSLPELCKEQINGIKKGLKEVLPASELKNIRRVIVTGCGDSYLAAKISIPALKKYAGAFASNFSACRAIEVSRHMNLKDQAECTLVIAVSASGGPARIQEALLRARQCGCKTLLVTNSPESRGAKAAEYILNVHTPAFPEPGPGLRNYYASLCGLFLFAAHMGEAKGTCTLGSVEELCSAIQTYTASLAGRLEEIHEKMADLTDEWNDICAIETLGDATDQATAEFIAAKFVEVAGSMTAAADYENWCHVNYFAHTPEKIGTILVSTKEFPDFGRVKETLHSVSGIGRKVLLITTGTKEDYEAEDSVCVITMPQAPEGYAFIETLADYVPGVILASCIAAKREEVYFRGGESPQGRSACGTTIGTSEVVLL